jgi:hypothetical protein
MAVSGTTWTVLAFRENAIKSRIYTALKTRIPGQGADIGEGTDRVQR